MFDDLLDSDFGVTGIRPELEKRVAEDALKKPQKRNASMDV